MRTFACVCGNHLFFENSRCLGCGREVGWCPACTAIRALEAQDQGLACASCGTGLIRCVNWVDHAVCNRCLPAVVEAGPPSSLCDCCRHNETIPDLTVEGNLDKWRQLEAAKRRLFYTLDRLALPYGTTTEGFEPPLAFDFKADDIPAAGLWRSVGEHEQVYTGHAGGKITINIKEADAAEREQLRLDLGESHRTLIGHFRHEIGHYYWELLVRDREVARFKAGFGDHESPGYEEALERHYAEGPPAGWQGSFVSAYATMHPWEDWAETFAFYLDIVDILDTAAGAGLIAAVPQGDVDAMLDSHARLGVLVNELNRAQGLQDLVPEVVTPAIRDKLALVHELIAFSPPGP